MSTYDPQVAVARIEQEANVSKEEAEEFMAAFLDYFQPQTSTTPVIDGRLYVERAEYDCNQLLLFVFQV
jgi:hypothetical protein